MHFTIPTLLLALTTPLIASPAPQHPHNPHRAPYPTPERITELFSVLGTDSAPTFFNATVSPSVSWTIMGTGTKAGTKTREEVVAAIRALGPKFKTRNYLEVRQVTGGVYLPWAAVELRSKPGVELVDGTTFNMTMNWMTRWEGELIVEVREYLDTLLITRVENIQV